MEKKIELIIDTQVIRAHCDRLFSQYEVHYVGQKKIFFYKISPEIYEYEVRSSDLHFLLTKLIDNVIIEGYARVANDRSIQARVKHFHGKGVLKDIFVICISPILIIATIYLAQDVKNPFLISLYVAIIFLSCFVLRNCINSLTTYGLKLIKRKSI